MIFVFDRSPAKKMTNTLFSCSSLVLGSLMRPTSELRMNMLPRVALNSRRSKLGILWVWMRPATKPRRASLAPGASRPCEGAGMRGGEGGGGGGGGRGEVMGGRM